MGSVIENMSDQERKLLYDRFSDHASFCRQSLVVETEAKTIAPMELSPGQLRLREAIKRQRDRGRPVRIIFLKSRRIMASTGTAAEFFHDTAFRAGVHTVVIAHDDETVQYLFGMYKRFHEKYRPFAGLIKLPPGGPVGDQINYEYGGEKKSSFIQVHTAGSANFGRGFRATNVHFSEYPYYPRPAQIRAALMSAVPKLPDTCVVVEGTAKTIGDDFHRLWQQSIDPASDSEWVGVFMGWYEHPANRMEPVSLEKFANSLTKDERELQGRFNLDMRQLAWRRYTIANDFSGDLIWFNREHPATPEEAFTASSRNRFSIPHIQRAPILRECLVGDVVMEDIGGEVKPVFLPNERGGSVRIYRMPERGRLYACGADPSGGVDINEGRGGEPDPDFAAAHFFDRDSHDQCAVLRARIMPGEFGRYLYRMLKFFNNAQIALENNGVGIGTMEALLNEGYPTSLFYHRPVEPDQDPAVRSDKIGWNTGEVSRQQLLSTLDEALRHGSIFVRDPMTQQELLTFVINSRGKAVGQSGCHDDLVISLALTVIVMARMPRPVPLPGTAPLRPAVSRYGQQQTNDSRGTIVRVRR